MRRLATSVALALAAAAALPGGGFAQGFGIYEQGACAMGRAGTGVAMPCGDGSAAFFNPAGLVDAPRRFTVGATGIVPSAQFVNDATGLASDLRRRLVAVPTVYAAIPLTEDLAIGAGVFVPYGLATEWDPNTAEGRFVAYRSQLRSVYFQPTIAGRFGPLEIGAGVDITNSSLRVNRRLDLSQLPVGSSALPAGTTFAALGIPAGTDFADASLQATAVSVGAHVGGILKLHERLRIGARYMTRQRFSDNEGRARFAPVNTGLILPPGNPLGAPGGTPVDALVAPLFATTGTLANQSFATNFALPAQVVFGVAARPVDRLTVLFDVQRVNWSALATVTADFAKAPDATFRQFYQDTWGYRAGAELALRKDTRVRVGYDTHDAAAPTAGVNFVLPEGKRSSFSAGVGTRLGQYVSADLAYQYIDQQDRRGSSTGSATANGLFRGDHAHLVGLSFVFDF